MLLWALFTAGYLLGVFITLKVFVSKDHVSDYRGVKSIDLDSSHSAWETHKVLVQPNAKTASSSKRSSIELQPQLA